MLKLCLYSTECNKPQSDVMFSEICYFKEGVSKESDARDSQQ